MPLVIAQCSTKKNAGERAAMGKYVTRFHNEIKAFMFDGGYAAGWDWSIMSAAKGLVHPTASVADYDAVLSNESEVQAWVAQHASQVQAEVASNDAADKILFVGSKRYLEALRAALPDRSIQHIGAGGRGCGDYFSALSSGFDLYSEDA